MANMATESIFLKVSCVNGKYVGLMCVHVLLVLLLSSIATSSKTILDTLPGYPGTLPFKLETGYVAVGEIDDLELFYYFVESQRNPVRDPLVLWLTGGPGCSALSGLLYEIGPLTFDYAAFNGSRPTLVQNPYSWTEVANVIFLDAPVGTGFSYSHTQEGYYSSDTESPQAIYLFLRKWLLDHPRYIKNPLYIAGDSYSGVIVPQVTLLISNGNRDGSVPPMSLLSIKAGCNEEYVDPDINNSTCIDDIGLVAEGTITDWKRCNKSLAYDSNLRTVVHYHDELLKRGYRALIYSGDHDMMIPYVGTLAWINFLNMTMVDGWRPWTVDGQIAGFTEKYARASGDGLTFATGGGHTAPEYKPKECLEMADRWMSFYGL
ncbi:serine carboxypeptidase-like 1 [Quercus suber]|uniref:Serine carboxypeptidase-like 1 n=1 Tax=Quercus suber TaxID=58331 RepID=A0AAW0L3P1_QUESU